MRHKHLIISILGLLLYSCSNIPDKSIFESLSTEELSKIIKKDTLFIDFYESQRKITEKFNEIDKAKFSGLTYRDLYKMYSYINDTTIMSPLNKEWHSEWATEFGSYNTKVDSVVNYWTKYKSDNSLNKFVTVEFAEVYKEYYTYSSDVKNVNLGFRLTPLQGKIEQIKFSYRYSAKINDFYGEKYNCILTSPFNSPVVRYWEVDYSNEKRLKNLSTTEFIRDYNIEIEITNIRKDEVNYSIDDLNIPKVVSLIIDNDSIRYPYLHQSYKQDVIKSILCTNYKSRNEFRQEKFEKLLKQKFPDEFAYVEYVSEK